MRLLLAFKSICIINCLLKFISVKKLDNLLKDYFEQHGDVPMWLIYSYGEKESIKILKSRRGRKIALKKRAPGIIDGEEFVYVD